MDTYRAPWEAVGATGGAPRRVAGEVDRLPSDEALSGDRDEDTARRHVGAGPVTPPVEFYSKDGSLLPQPDAHRETPEARKADLLKADRPTGIERRPGSEPPLPAGEQATPVR